VRSCSDQLCYLMYLLLWLSVIVNCAFHCSSNIFISYILCSFRLAILGVSETESCENTHTVVLPFNITLCDTYLNCSECVTKVIISNVLTLCGVIIKFHVFHPCFKDTTWLLFIFMISQNHNNPHPEDPKVLQSTKPELSIKTSLCYWAKGVLNKIYASLNW
jgi:hypothetical protein